MERNSKRHLILRILLGVVIFALAQVCAFAQVTATSSTATSVPPVANPCPRPFAPGSVVHNPQALFSSNGVLSVRFSYQHRIDSNNRELFCFMTPDGLQNPTLHVKPGDRLIITVTNNTPATPVEMTINAPNCGATQMTGSSLNIHYHGTNTSPTCHSDEVIKTLINSGETFQYNVAFPTNEPPGLYWYHPHVHGLVEHALQGGAAGAIVVDGIQNVQPAVSGLRHRVLIVRDQNVPGSPAANGSIPSWDVSLNFVPITSPSDPNSTNFVPAVLHMESGEKQFWRVSNSCSDTILDLQVRFDGVPQTIQLVGIDAVPVNSQDGTQPGHLIPVKHFRLPPASRVEFIVSAPPASVQHAQLITLGINTGAFGDNDPQRPLATIKLVDPDNDEDGANDDNVGSFTALNTNQRRFSGLGSAHLTARRTLFFDEIQPTQFFITVVGQPEQLFDPNAPPAITTTQGSVEEWTIENHAVENHEFHFHQLHFLVESQNNFEINGYQQAPGINGQFLDMIELPTWDGNPNHPFPSVTVRIDFRGNDIGDFVYHCHITGHEDLGMMAIIRVLPAGSAANSNSPTKPSDSVRTTGSTKAVKPVPASTHGKAEMKMK